MLKINDTKTKLTNEEADALLQRYYEGLTSVAEERALKAFLSQHSLPSRFEADRVLLGYFAEQKPKSKPVLIPLMRWGSIAAALVGAVFLVKALMPGTQPCYAYIDGQRSTDMAVVTAQAMASLHEISSARDEVKESGRQLNNDELVREQLQIFSENK